LAAVEELEKKLEATNLAIGSSSTDRPVSTELSAISGESATGHIGEQAIQPVSVQPLIFSSFQVKSHAQMPPIPSGVDKSDVEETQALSAPRRLQPAVDLLQIGALEHETELLLRVIQQMRQRLLEGDISAEAAGHHIKMQYDFFSVEAAHVLEYRSKGKVSDAINAVYVVVNRCLS